MTIDVYFRDIIAFIKGSGPKIASSMLIVSSLSIVHFSSYILFFDSRLTILLELNSITRFFLNGLFFFTLFYASVRVVTSVLWGAQPPEILPMQKTASAFGWVNPFLPTKAIFDYFIGFLLFLLNYIGFKSFVLLFVFILLYLFLQLVISGFVRVILGKKLESDGAGVVSLVFFYSFLIVLSAALGNLRAAKVARNNVFEMVFLENSNSLPNYSTGILIEENDRNNDALNLTAVFLTSSTGVFVYSQAEKRAWFIPWDTGLVLRSIEQDGSRFSLEEVFVEFRLWLKSQTSKN